MRSSGLDGLRVTLLQDYLYGGENNVRNYLLFHLLNPYFLFLNLILMKILPSPDCLISLNIPPVLLLGNLPFSHQEQAALT